ncbi:MAG: HAD hydrolase-like protein [Candidatus Omnitrophota bacterium]
MKINQLMSEYSAFIFDFDGVIVDSLPIKTEAFGQLFEDLGSDVMAKVRAYHLDHGGVSRYEKFKYYYREFRGREISSDESRMLDEKFSALVVEKVIKAEAIPGVMNVLQGIKAAGKFCCVVSATPQEEIRLIVNQRGMVNLFDEVVGSPRSKKDNVGLVLEKYHLVAQEAVYFGDARSDQEAARFHGVSFIGVVPDKGGELSSVAGIMRVRDFREILDKGACHA